MLGKIYQREDKFDEAIAEFNLCTANSKSADVDNQDATVFLGQCNTAKKITSKISMPKKISRTIQDNFVFTN